MILVSYLAKIAEIIFDFSLLNVIICLHNPLYIDNQRKLTTNRLISHFNLHPQNTYFLVSGASLELTHCHLQLVLTVFSMRLFIHYRTVWCSSTTPSKSKLIYYAHFTLNFQYIYFITFPVCTQHTGKSVKSCQRKVSLTALSNPAHFTILLNTFMQRVAVSGNTTKPARAYVRNTCIFM